MPNQSIVTFSPRSNFEDASTFASETNGSLARHSHLSSMSGFMKEIDNVQQQLVIMTKKVEKEKKRNDDLDTTLELSRKKLLDMQIKTRNGSIMKEDENVNKKTIHRLEHQLQTARIKLSVARRDNLELKNKINEERKKKLMHLHINQQLQHDLDVNRIKAQKAAKDVVTINDKKHQLQVEIAGMKVKMFHDMEDYTRDIAAVKSTIQHTQENIMDSIKERLALTYNNYDANKSSFSRSSSSHAKKVSTIDPNSTNDEIYAILAMLGLSSIEELVQVSQKAEENIFFVYNEIQADNKEYDKLETANKHLERELNDKVTQLENLEGSNDKLKKELENNIYTIQSNIAKYDQKYLKHMDVFNSVSDSLMNLLKNIAVEEYALDQQLLSTGITDRNVQEFLGLIEQRIDDLIQMSKAAVRQGLRKEDFLRTINEKNIIFQPPSLPTLDNTNDDDDEDDNHKLQPISINMLKDYMNQKIKRSIAKTPVTPSRLIVSATNNPRMSFSRNAAQGVVPTTPTTGLIATSPRRASVAAADVVSDRQSKMLDKLFSSPTPSKQ